MILRNKRWQLRVVAMAVLAGLVLAACGGGGDDDGDGGDAAAEADPNGVLRRAVNMEAGGGLKFDPVVIGTGHYSLTYPVLDSLLKAEADGTFSPGLATEATIVDPRTIKVTLRPDVKFSDGSPLDAQTAADSIIRTRDGKAPGLRVAELAYISSIDVAGPTEFTINLNQPYAGLFYYLLAEAETAPVARATMDTPGDHSRDVIAAGPFKLESYAPGSLIRMVKNENYWDAANVKLAAVEYVHVEEPAAAVNALNAGQADWVSGQNLVSVQDTEGFGAGFKGENHLQYGPYQMNVCIREGDPLGDKRVRQALNYATDREALNQVVFMGKSEPAWGFFPKDHPLYTTDLDEVYDHDPDKAKQLLREAGYANGLTLTSIVEAGGGVTTRMNEVLQAQWAEVGVKLNIVPSPNTTADWYLANGSKGDMNLVPLIRGVGSVTRNFATSAFANVCKTQMPAIDDQAEELLGLDQTSGDAAEAWDKMQKTVIEDVVWGVMTVFPVQSIVHSEKLGGVEYRLDGINQRQPDVTKVFVKK